MIINSTRNTRQRRGTGWGGWFLGLGVICGGVYCFREFLKSYVVPLYFPEEVERERRRLRERGVRKSVGELMGVVGTGAGEGDVDVVELAKAVRDLKGAMVEERRKKDGEVLEVLEGMKKELEELKREKREREREGEGEVKDETRDVEVSMDSSVVEDDDSQITEKRESPVKSRTSLVLRAGGYRETEENRKLSNVVGPMTDTSSPHSPTSITPIVPTIGYGPETSAAMSKEEEVSAIQTEKTPEDSLVEPVHEEETSTTSAVGVNSRNLETAKESNEQSDQDDGIQKDIEESTRIAEKTQSTRNSKSENDENSNVSPLKSVTRYSTGKSEVFGTTDADAITTVETPTRSKATDKAEESKSLEEENPKENESNNTGKRLSGATEETEKSTVDSPQLSEYARDLQAESNSGLAMISGERNGNRRGSETSSKGKKTSPSGAVRAVRGESIVFPSNASHAKNDQNANGSALVRVSEGASNRGSGKRMGLRLSREEAAQVPVENGGSSKVDDDDDDFMKIAPAEVEKSWIKTKAADEKDNTGSTRSSADAEQDINHTSIERNGVSGSSVSANNDGSWIKKPSRVLDTETQHSEESMDKDETTPLLQASVVEEARRKFHSAMMEKVSQSPIAASGPYMKRWRVQSAPGVETDLP